MVDVEPVVKSSSSSFITSIKNGYLIDIFHIFSCHFLLLVMAMVLNRCLIGAFMARLMDESKFLQNNPRLGIHPQETVDLGKP
jgi:hypothetical protein